jgi:RNA polymerase sigma-70 factor (ECF subfamily)
MTEMHELSDAQLVVAVGRFRSEALAEAYRRHGGAVMGLAGRVMGDATEAEDVTQDVFVRLWDRPDQFDPSRGSLRTYLLTLAHSRAVDLIRSRSARRGREERDARSTAAAGYDVDLEVRDLTLADQVERAMASLTDDERRAIELAYFEGHTYREVAVLLDQPEGTVKSRIRSGLRRMRRSLADHEKTER